MTHPSIQLLEGAGVFLFTPMSPLGRYNSYPDPRVAWEPGLCIRSVGALCGLNQMGGTNAVRDG